MNDDPLIDKIFTPFREAKAPSGFTQRVMTRLKTETMASHPWVHFFGFGGTSGRWAWAGGLALAASVMLMIPQKQTTAPSSPADLSIYLADSNQIEEEADLGTQIESYFL